MGDDEEIKSRLAEALDHREMLLVAGILSPNTSSTKPPTVTNQPRMKYVNGSVPHAWAMFASDRHLWYAGESISIDLMTIIFDIATTAIPANTRTLFIAYP
jgi:hypothetical protein